MGARIEVGEVTFGDLFRLNPALAIEFPNADPRGIVPATIPSHGFDIVFDGRTYTIVVPITLPPKRSFDNTSGWRWSELTPLPFAIGDPWVSATFRADGVRVRMDGQYCTPIIPPLP